jgi:D-alanyl-D-alanine carboxypeptidase (penicillin-binding protein 5/6)
MMNSSMHTRVYTSGTAVRPPKKRAHWGRRLSALAFIALAVYVGAASWLIPAHAVAGTTTVSAYPQTSTQISLSWPDTGQAAIGAEDYGLLATHKTDAAIPTASTIKLVTALSVLAKHPLLPGQPGPSITMTEKDAELYNWYFANHGSVIPVRAGERLTERQALNALLLRSANNMADTLARWAFGSHENYRTYANNYVRQLGMKNTSIGTDASGFAPDSTSTASDLVTLGLAVMKNPALAEIVGQKSAVIPEVGTIHNTNNLLGVRGIVGIKTGNNDEDKGAYIFASDYAVSPTKTVRIVGTVMGASSVAAAKQDALALLVSAEKGFVGRTLFKTGAEVGNFQPEWSTQPVKAVVANDVTVLGWRGTPLHLNIALETVSAPAKAGDKVGTITVGIGAQKKVVGKIILDDSITKPSLWWRLTHPLYSRQLVQQNG